MTLKSAQLLFVFLLALAESVMAAKPNLNPEHGSPPYREFSVFSPDASSPAEYRQSVVVVLHGFMSAVPNSAFKRVRKSYSKPTPRWVSTMTRWMCQPHSNSLQKFSASTSLGDESSW